MPRAAQFGFARTLLGPFSIGTNVLNSTSKIIQLTSAVFGFEFELEKVIYNATVAHAGGGGTRTVNIRKGSDTGTVVASANPTTAGFGTAGITANGTLAGTALDRKFSDTDGLSIEAAAGGTAITSGTGELWIIVRHKLQRAA